MIQEASFSVFLELIPVNQLQCVDICLLIACVVVVLWC